MFERPHHCRIAILLAALRADLLLEWGCYFGGGTAVALCLGEFRESVYVDFLCSSQEGYRSLRAAVFPGTLDALFRQPVKQLRELRSDQYGVRTFLEVDGAPVRLEFVREARLELAGALDPGLGVPLLTREDLFAEKLLANADRAHDAATFNRDAVDLGLMASRWGPPPRGAIDKARLAYGDTIDRALATATTRLKDPAQLERCLTALKMDPKLAPELLAGLDSSLAALGA